VSSKPDKGGLYRRSATPVTVRSGHTGLAGGALPLGSGLLTMTVPLQTRRDRSPLDPWSAHQPCPHLRL